ncbi:hypothetical protein RJ641_032526 [Dillenia turbinata]|uniref:Uncharacterized protein n=1 Tax=Dillenia turbinata TaxID=194707 RepID=A0AAN8ZLW8_9MAGN
MVVLTLFCFPHVPEGCEGSSGQLRCWLICLWLSMKKAGNKKRLIPILYDGCCRCHHCLPTIHRPYVAVVVTAASTMLAGNAMAIEVLLGGDGRELTFDPSEFSVAPGRSYSRTIEGSLGMLCLMRTEFHPELTLQQSPCPKRLCLMAPERLSQSH